MIRKDERKKAQEKRTSGGGKGPGKYRTKDKE